MALPDGGFDVDGSNWRVGTLREQILAPLRGLSDLAACCRPTCDRCQRCAIIIALGLVVVGCAPAAGAKYSRHLRMSHEPTHVNAESYAAAQRLYGEPHAASVLAGVMSDDEE